MSKIERRKRAIQDLKDLYSNPNVLIIHYSNESVYGSEDGRNPRIITIAVMYLGSAQKKSFAIHKVAELKNIPLADIRNHIDEIEKEMLFEFFEFVRNHKSHFWLHWKMCDINYGFEAIEHRYKVLGGTPEIVDDDKKYCLSELLKDKYGHGYISKPRFYNLMEKNKFEKQNLMSGKEEVVSIKNNEFIKVHKSMLSKLDAIEGLLVRAAENTLKTEAKIWDRYGITPQGLFEWTKENWFGAVAFAIISFIVGVFATYLKSLYFPPNP